MFTTILVHEIINGGCSLTSSRARWSEVALDKACTTNQLHLLSSMSVPTFPVTFGSP